MITLSLESFFDRHKHCSRLQPLRARLVLPVSFSFSHFSLDNANLEGLVRAEFEI
jgi:hypothetical protein